MLCLKLASQSNHSFALGFIALVKNEENIIKIFFISCALPFPLSLKSQNFKMFALKMSILTIVSYTCCY